MTQLFLREKLYVPIKLLKKEDLDEKYTRRVYKEQNCAKCPYLEDRFGENCEECANYLGVFKLYSKVDFKSGTYYGLPIGNKKRLNDLLPKYAEWRKAGKVKDLRPRTPFKYKWKWKKDRPLWDYQEDPVADMVKYGYGQLEAPPRSGKTVMMIRVAKELGMKTLIIAHQGELLDQFIEALETFTNYNFLKAKYGDKVAGICKTYKDFLKYDICLVNYQHFISEKNGEARLKAIRKLFGTVIVDEAHRSAAKCYSKVLNNLSARYKMACTGTIDRKDGLHFIVKEIVGPVKAVADVQMLVPAFQFVSTPVESGRQFNNWSWFTKYLANHKKRNNLIVSEAIKYVKQGRSVVIPITFVDHANKLVDMINKKYGKNIASAFTGKNNTKETRKAMVLAARSGKIKVFIGMRQLVQEGLNVPIWSVLLEVMPISNPPKFKQETARVCTPMEGKPMPIIRMLCDNLSISRGCMRTCVYQGAYKLGFSISKEDKVKFAEYCKGKMPSQGLKVGKRF